MIQTVGKDEDSSERCYQIRPDKTYLDAKSLVNITCRGIGEDVCNTQAKAGYILITKRRDKER